MKTKRCCGYKGHHACGEEFPDHMVPVEMFGPEITRKDGRQARCRTCMAYRNDKLPRHPVTNQRKVHWKHATAESLGGIPGAPEWPSYLDRAEELWVEEITDCISAPAVYTIVNKGLRVLPVFDDGRPKKSGTKKSGSSSKRSKEREEGPGSVYIYRDDDILWRKKIGAQKIDKGRLAEAGTWGCYRQVYSCWFPERFKAEKMVHETLHEYRLYAKKELFRVDIQTAVDAILAVKHLLEDEEFVGETENVLVA